MHRWNIFKKQTNFFGTLHSFWKTLIFIFLQKNVGVLGKKIWHSRRKKLTCDRWTPKNVTTDSYIEIQPIFCSIRWPRAGHPTANAAWCPVHHALHTRRLISRPRPVRSAATGSSCCGCLMMHPRRRRLQIPECPTCQWGVTPADGHKMTPTSRLKRRLPVTFVSNLQIAAWCVAACEIAPFVSLLYFFSTGSCSHQDC